MRGSSVLLMVLLSAACAPMNDGASASAASPSLEGTQWTVTSIAGQPAVAGSNVTLKFDQGNISGSAGCNQYNGPYTISGSSLELGNMVATKRACAEREKNVQESAYLGMLSKVKAFRQTGDRLVLKDAAGTTLLEYRRG